MRGQKLLAEHGDGEPREVPGCGVAVECGDSKWSLGKAGWMAADGKAAMDAAGSELRENGLLIAHFNFHESLRPGSLAMLRSLERGGLSLHILSGDQPDKVRRLAEALELPAARAHGGLSPAEKAARVRGLDARDTLYLGDGANDSLAFDEALATGTPVVDRSLLESKADFYTLGQGLGFLPGVLDAAAARVDAVRAAFGFALLYNLTAVALSMSGKMSPLLAAVLMPLSSLVSIAIVAGISRRKIPNKG
jgi:Cu2+-exporting ATPase